jgi:hypothetical protein
VARVAVCAIINAIVVAIILHDTAALAVVELAVVEIRVAGGEFFLAEFA